MCNGTIKALGLQATAVKLNLIAYWLVATSCTFILGFYLDYGYVGIRIAMFLAQLFVGVSFALLVERADWH